MGKKHGLAVKRARKKHEREQKRKKVLAQKRQATAARAVRHPPSALPGRAFEWRPSVEGIAGFATRTRLHFYEAAHTVAHLACADCGHSELPEAVWTRDKVAALETLDILERLERLGIRATRDEFLAGTPPFGSAVEYARKAWLPRALASVDVHGRDLLLLAACELWTRWRPEAPSQEMLLEPLLSGRASDCHDDDIEATEHWIRFWSLLRPLLTPEMGKTSAVDALLGGRTEPFFNWASDFSTAAMGAALHDQDLGRQAAQALEEVLSQFAGEEDDWRLPLLEEHAELLYSTGERDRGERILRELMEKYPTRAGAYLTLADLWAPYDCKDHEQLCRAMALLEQAVALPVEDGEDWDLDIRIEELREQIVAADPTHHEVSMTA